MEASEIIAFITTLTTIVSGGGWWVSFRAAKRKANAEASQTERQTDSIAIDALNKTIEALRDGDNNNKAIIEKKDAKIEEQYNEKVDLRNENTACKLLMCIHLGCILREPIHGQGDTWYDGHKADPAIGADYLPINQLMKMYGKNKDSKTEENEKDN